MESFFSRYRNVLVLIVVLVAQLLALAMQVRRPESANSDARSVSLLRYSILVAVEPPERLIRATESWIGSVWGGYVDLVHVRRQNAALNLEVQRLRLEQAELAQDAAQGRRLQQMLGFQEHYIHKTLAAQVIGTGGSEQSQVVYINKGSDDGLKSEMPVITVNGIVGKIKNVYAHTSQVLLISDPTSGVGVMFTKTGIQGILKGRAFGQVAVVNMSSDTRIKAGDAIVTSGGDQIFPRGLPVGAVVRTVSDPGHDPLVNVLVRPAANLAALNEVLVITDLSGSVSSQEAKDIAESEAVSAAQQKRTADILAARLPGLVNPNAPADTNPRALINANGTPVPVMPTPPQTIHPDGFTPGNEPPASEMIPGHRYMPVRHGTENVVHPVAPSPSAAPNAANPGGSGARGGAGKTPSASGAAQPGAVVSGPSSVDVTHGSPAAKARTKPSRQLPARPVGPISGTSAPHGGIR